MKRLSMGLILILLLALTGCHGKVDRAGFKVPEQFDEGRTYEITVPGRKEGIEVIRDLTHPSS